MKPKKPHSAQRKIAKIKLSSGIRITARIPGIGHSVQEHNIVLVDGTRAPDLPGVRYTVLRGVYDVTPVFNRKTSRSRYGVMKKK